MNLRSTIMKVFVVTVLLLLSITVNVYAYDYYPDDIYEGDYSLEEMLKNYSVITFGRNDVDSTSGISKGDVKLFHINSQFLINGRLTYGQDIRADFRNGNNNLKSYVKGTDRNLYCGNGIDGSCNNDSTLYSDTQFDYNDKSTVVGNYMNFDRLYEKIVDSQSRIPKGEVLDNATFVSGPYGSKYILSVNFNGQDYSDGYKAFYIDDYYFTDARIYFLDFYYYELAKDKLIIITIDAPGTIVLPKVVSLVRTSNYYENSLFTNDYYGMERPNSDYALHYVPEGYEGNIIWNIPNATEVLLEPYSYVGHIIAPNADIVSPENQFAGTMIANSISFEGRSEAHFYPLRVDNIPYISNPDVNFEATSEVDDTMGSFSFSDGLNAEELQEGMVVTFRINPKSGYHVSDIIIEDEDGNKVEFREVGDGEYQFTMPASNVKIKPSFEKNKISDIITNPKTRRTIFALLLPLLIIGIGIYSYRKRESKKI